jgi:RES domain-containing protein
LSGAGAALYGGRFNPQGQSALYLALDLMTAITEANRGFANKINPCVMCGYDIDCADLADLRTEADRAAAGVALADMACPWFPIARAGDDPPSWRLARALRAAGLAGLLYPSFAPGAPTNGCALVLWDWAATPPRRRTK